MSLGLKLDFRAGAEKAVDKSGKPAIILLAFGAAGVLEPVDRQA